MCLPVPHPSIHYFDVANCERICHSTTLDHNIPPTTIYVWFWWQSLSSLLAAAVGLQLGVFSHSKYSAHFVVSDYHWLFLWSKSHYSEWRWMLLPRTLAMLYLIYLLLPAATLFERQWIGRFRSAAGRVCRLTGIDNMQDPLVHHHHSRCSAFIVDWWWWVESRGGRRLWKS